MSELDRSFQNTVSNRVQADDLRSATVSTIVSRGLSTRCVVACAALWAVVAAPAWVRADIPGACCFPDGSCEAYVNNVACDDDGGTFAGFGVTCDNADCVAVEPECDEALAFEACPQTIVVETEDADGALFTLPNLPAVSGCDVAITFDPPLESILPTGENTILAMATDAYGEMAMCEFVIRVILIDVDGPTPKRRIKGGGNIDGSESGVCGTLLPAGGSACGACPMAGLMATCLSLVAGRRRACRKSRCTR